MSEKTALSPEERKRRKKKYRKFIPAIRDTARQLGYAIGVHGTQSRDLDLIAVPWVQDAVNPDELVLAITLTLKKLMPRNRWLHCYLAEFNHEGKWPAPGKKPHGRVAYTITTGHGREGWGEFIDLSIMPRAKNED